MKKVLGMLEGKKTYLVALLVGVLTVVQSLGYMDMSSYQMIMGLLGAGGLASLRAGMKK